MAIEIFYFSKTYAILEKYITIELHTFQDTYGCLNVFLPIVVLLLEWKCARYLDFTQIRCIDYFANIYISSISISSISSPSFSTVTFSGDGIGTISVVSNPP